jgi:hypothetical protein
LIKCDENYFEIIDSADKSYYLGFIGGDGYINDKANFLFIGLAIKDRKFLENFLLALKSEHPIYSRCISLKKTNKFYEGCSIKITRPKLVADLIKHGIGPNKSKELSIPKTIPDEFIKDFIRGIICSDGCWSIDKKNNMNFSFLSSVYSFAEEVKLFLMNKCDLRDVKIAHCQGCFNVKWGGNVQCERIFKYLYSNGPWLERKYELALEHFEKWNNIPKSNALLGKLAKQNLQQNDNVLFKDDLKENPKILSNLDRILGFGKIN